MKTIHISKSPIAGAPLFTARMLDEAGHSAIAFAPSMYSDGRDFNLWPNWHRTAFGIDQGPRDDLIADADVLVVYNNSAVAWVLEWMKKKPSVMIYCSPPNSLRHAPGEIAVPFATWASYHATLEEYKGATVLPQLIPIHHEWYVPVVRDDPAQFVIGYSPSIPTETGGWDSKGYTRTMSLLNHLARFCTTEVLMGKPHAEVMQHKQHALLWVDELITGAYHKNTLEALSVGCLPAVNISNAIADVVERIYGSVFPHLKSDCDGFIEKARRIIAEPGAWRWYAKMTRLWTESYSDPTRLIEEHYIPFFRKAVKLK